jgi:branched-chain amino acid transport system permease protein
MIAYIIAGLVLGGIYAISAASIVVTYVSAGVLNFAFGAIAFFIARFYYFLVIEHGWPILPAAALAIGVVGPMFGMAMHFLLFRFLTRATELTKVVATIGLSVAIPAGSELIFGNRSILTSPGLAPRPVHVYHLAGAAVTLDQIIAFGAVVAVLAAGVYVLRYTEVGLMVRATVDSEAMTSISGISPNRVAVGVWAAGTFLAGLAGVLAAPILNVSSVTNYTVLTASAFAAVVAARLRSLPIAVAVGLLMGVLGSVLQWLLPAGSHWTADIVTSIPFVMVVVFLLFYSWRGVVGGARTGGTLDRAIEVLDPGAQAQRRGAVRSLRPRSPQALARATAGLLPRNLFIVVAAVLPLLLTGYRVGLVGAGLAIGVVFLSYTLLTGEGGIISLCQISFAGIGALTTGQMTSVYHLPVLVGVLVGGLIAGVGGLIVGALTVRMGNLYVALATLTFGLLLSGIVFKLDRFLQFGAGVTVLRPGFITSDHNFAYFMLVVFALVGLLIAAIRSSTAGLALAALRASEIGARASGVNVVGMKIAVSALAAVIAGVGGGCYALYAGVALPETYDAFIGLVWFAVLVTNGTRSNNAALAAGLFYVFLPDIFDTYLPTSWGPFPTLLFGAGAVLLARHPEGVITLNGRQLGALARRLGAAIGHRSAAVGPGPAVWRNTARDAPVGSSPPVPLSVERPVVALEKRR